MNSNYERGESLKIYVWMNYMSVPRNARMIYTDVWDKEFIGDVILKRFGTGAGRKRR